MTAPAAPRPVLVVMGVSGSGKSSIGAVMADRLHLPFEDGDALQPAANIAKMASGHPLADADRWPWLDRVAEAIKGWRRAKTGGVIACSALKRAYRDRLAAPDVIFVYLAETPATIRARLAHRKGHFMPAALIDSQFETLEPLQPDEQGRDFAAGGECGNAMRRILRALAL